MAAVHQRIERVRKVWKYFHGKVNPVVKSHEKGKKTKEIEKRKKKDGSPEKS